MNDAERWINGEGPEPAAITELLASSRAAAREARAEREARAARDMEWTPELEARLHRNFTVALAAQRRGWARARRIKIAVAVGAGAAVVAGVVAVVLRAGVPAGLTLPGEMAPSVLELAPAEPTATATATGAGAPAPRR